MAGKKKKDPSVVRNRRVMIYTFLLILTLLYISGHSAAEKQKREAAAAGAGLETSGEAAAVTETEDESGRSSEPNLGTEPSVSAEGNEGEYAAAGVMADEEGPGGESQAADRHGEDGKSEKSGEAGEALERGNEENAEAKSGDVNGTGDEVLKVGETPEEKTEEASLAISQDELWCLILTNAEYPVPEDYAVTLKDVPGTEQTVDERIYGPLMEMVEAMKEEGLSPIVCSGYRTLDKQEKLFNRKVQSYVKSGHTKQESYELARQTISIPGSGEHCLGLAVDFFTNKYHRLETGFENTPEGKWLRDHAQDYGFILRYDRGKEEITGIQYEPWHFRYVGVKVAQYLKEYDLSLEEFYIEESLYG